ncbi:MAG TPA: hypothetical protein VFQ45_05155 [Longimicrobium sp.]|nr:hypothetical protein [Longimicrobium sp.]
MSLRVSRFLPLLLAAAAAAPLHAQPRQMGRFTVTNTTDPETGADASVAVVTETAPAAEPAALVWACHGPALRTAFAFPGTWTSTDALLAWRFDAEATEAREVVVQPVEGALAVVLPPELAAAITARARGALHLLVSLETDDGRQLHAFEMEGADEALELLACAAAVQGGANAGVASRADARLLNPDELATEAARLHPPALAGQGAEVRVFLEVGPDGRPVEQSMVMFGDVPAEFRDAARRVAAVARFTPASRRGVAESSWTSVTVTFRPQRRAP